MPSHRPAVYGGDPGDRLPRREPGVISGTPTSVTSAPALCEEVEEALAPFKAWQLSWVPRAMDREADKLVDQAFRGEPVVHARDAEGSGTEIVADAPPPRKAASWREGFPAEMAEYLQGHRIIPDRAWT